MPKTPNHDSPERFADSVQAQIIVDELDRILADVNTRPGLKGIKNHSAPSKTRWHKGFLLIRHPDGQQNVDDSDTLNIASVSSDEDDGSRTSFGVELSGVNGLIVTKHIYPPSESEARETETLLPGEVDYSKLAIRAAADLLQASGERDSRIEERNHGLHRANYGETVQLIESLRQLDQVPGHEF